MKSIKKILFLVFLSINIHAQISNIHIGGGFGFGSIAGNSPSQSAYNSNIFIGLQTSATGEVIFRLNYLYASKINSILPENRQDKYYPFMHVVNLTVSLNQLISESFYIQGGIGPLIIYDRIFHGEEFFDIGIAVDAGIFFNIIKSSDTKLDLGLTGSFGETFTNSLASYNLYRLTAIYFL